MIKRKVGESMAFTGGAERTPSVSVTTFNAPGSLHHGDKTLHILDTASDQRVLLSLETMKAIIEWAEKD